jgi:hypothetical protein
MQIRALSLALLMNIMHAKTENVATIEEEDGRSNATES